MNLLLSVRQCVAPDTAAGARRLRLDGVHDRVEHGVGRRLAVDLGQHARLAVVVDHGSGVLLVDTQPFACGLLGIVLPLDQLPAALVADARFLGRLELDVEVLAARLTHPVNRVTSSSSSTAR